MATLERLYTVEDVWRLACAPENEAKRICLIDGALVVAMSPGFAHARIASEIARLMGNFASEQDAGIVTVESGHYPPQDRRTLVLPDVAFTRTERAPGPDAAEYVPVMPDLAVEIISPSQSLPQARRKAHVYLKHGTTVVWLVDPAEKRAEQWSIGDTAAPRRVSVGTEGELSGGGALPGFTMPLTNLFRG